MKVIITGASGFIGRNLLQQLPSNWDAVAIFHNSPDFNQFVSKLNNPNLIIRRCDLTNEADVIELKNDLGEEFNLCVYLAANGDPAYSVKDPISDFRQNALATVNFLNNLSVDRFIYFSSGAVYDGLSGSVDPSVNIQPKLPYAISKLVAESYIHYFREIKKIKEFVILRFFGAFGPYEPARKIYSKLINIFIEEQKNEFIITGDGNNNIDAMYVDDTINGIFKVCESKVADVIVDFCNGKPITINELVLRAAKAFGVESPKLVHQGEVSEYIMFKASPDDMKAKFGFEPKISLEDGLRKFVSFLSTDKSAVNV